MIQDGSAPRPATTGRAGTGRSPGRAAAGRLQRLHGHAGRGRPAEGHLLLPGSGPARKCSGGWPGPPTEARSRRPNRWWSPRAAMACRRLALHQRARPAPRRGEGPGRGDNRWWRPLLARRKIRHRHQCHGPGGPPAPAGRRGARHRPHRPDRVAQGRYGALPMASRLGPCPGGRRGRHQRSTVAVGRRQRPGRPRRGPGLCPQRRARQRHAQAGMPAGLDCGPDDPFMVANRAFARALASAAATFDPWAHPEQCWTAHAGAL